jgi:hypothetical protein
MGKLYLWVGSWMEILNMRREGKRWFSVSLGFLWDLFFGGNCGISKFD